ncbi:MAG TPA: response regulator transcription factor [Solirubrobacteraceae bacterium]|jgi:DNA-binding NarL/FixJ family response regulator|nr:response regulator transcription factor [Solirubrobacteraceae bacterium]
MADGFAKPIRVVIADDAYVIREGLVATLSREPDIELVGCCSDGNELSEVIADQHPDVVITDLRMPPGGDGEGIRIASRLRESDPNVGVMVLTQYIDSAYAVALMQGGSSGRGYLLKDRIRDRAQLVSDIREVAAHGSVLDPRVIEALIEARTSEDSKLAALTPREHEILAEIAEGKSNAAIAESLVLTKRAVEKHVNSIFAKLDLPEPDSVSRRVKAALLFLADEHRLSPPRT